MRSQWFFKYIPSAQSLKNNRFLKPFARYLHYDFLWQFNRRAVAGGVAVGLFFGILVPFAQIVLAAIAAIILRLNLPTAVFSTLITNPLTFPAIYYLAYRLGDVLTGSTEVPNEQQINQDIQQAVTVQQGDVSGWFPSLLEWVQTVGFPLIIGLVVLAVAAAVIGYFAVSIVWKVRVRQRWNHRRHHRRLDLF